MTTTDSHTSEPTQFEQQTFASTIFTTLRQPEYTGENRCSLCTILNIVIAATIAGLAGLVSLSGGGVLFLVFAATIYFRGYLIPYTPELTKRYFPDRILTYFDHHEAEAGRKSSGNSVELDPERILRAAGAIELCESGTDLCLTTDFKRDLYTTITKLRSDGTERSALAPVLDVDAEDLDFVEYGDAFAAFVDDQKAGQWESRAAFLADVAAADVLSHRYDPWAEFRPPERGGVLGALRVFLTECPSCGGPVSFGRDTVESCCRELEVVAVTCDSCGARLFEQNAELLNL